MMDEPSSVIIFPAMKRKAIYTIPVLAVCLFCAFPRLRAQDTSQRHIDPSKPSNLYTRLSNNAEYTFRKGNNTYGYRASFVWASKNGAHAAYIELPLLVSSASGAFGPGDMRFRYFWFPYKDYSRKPSAFGLTMDTYAPTGSYDRGLGSGRWRVSPGIYTGFVFGKFSTFPIFSYLYTSANERVKIPTASNKDMNGMTVQSICVFNMNGKSYLDCTPAFLLNDFTDASKNDFRIEGNYLYMIKKNRLQVGCFARRTFRIHVTTIRASVRLYF